MTDLEILERSFASAELPRCRGVYLLIHRGEVVYVGSSRDIVSRIGSHAISKMRFDRVLWLRLPWKQALRIEGVLTRFFSPRNNTGCPPWRGRDNATLISLGIPPYADERVAVQPWLDKQHASRRQAGLNAWKSIRGGISARAAREGTIQ